MLLAGKRFEVQLEYSPLTAGLHEAFFRVSIAQHNLSQVLLVVGSGDGRGVMAGRRGGEGFGEQGVDSIIDDWLSVDFLYRPKANQIGIDEAGVRLGRSVGGEQGSTNFLSWCDDRDDALAHQ